MEQSRESEHDQSNNEGAQVLISIFFLWRFELFPLTGFLSVYQNFKATNSRVVHLHLRTKAKSTYCLLDAPSSINSP